MNKDDFEQQDPRMAYNKYHNPQVTKPHYTQSKKVLPQQPMFEPEYDQPSYAGGYYPEEPMMHQPRNRASMPFVSQSFQDSLPSHMLYDDAPGDYYNVNPRASPRGHQYPQMYMEQEMYGTSTLNQSLDLMKMAAMMNNSRTSRPPMMSYNQPPNYGMMNQMYMQPEMDQQYMAYQAMQNQMMAQKPAPAQQLPRLRSFDLPVDNNTANSSLQVTPRKPEQEVSFRQHQVHEGGQQQHVKEDDRRPQPHNRHSEAPLHPMERINVFPPAENKNEVLHQQAHSQKNIEQLRSSSNNIPKLLPEENAEEDDAKAEVNQEITPQKPVQTKADYSVDDIPIQTKKLTFEELLAQNLKNENMKDEQQIFGKQVKTKDRKSRESKSNIKIILLGDDIQEDKASRNDSVETQKRSDAVHQSTVIDPQDKSDDELETYPENR